MAAPGWYPDTTMAGTQRYWDGQRWTEHRAPLGAPPAAAPPQPRLRADGSVRGPSLLVAVLVLGLGVVLAVAASFVLIPAFVDSLSGPRWAVPGSNRAALDDGAWVLYERVDVAGSGAIGPDDVTIEGPASVVPRFDSTNETITINDREYVGVVRFDVDVPGTYEITVRGEPSQRGEVLLARPIWDLFSRWPWFLAGGAGGLLAIVGTTLWIVGGVNRGRARRAGFS